jgi:hypothetical protein
MLCWYIRKGQLRCFVYTILKKETVDGAVLFGIQMEM